MPHVDWTPSSRTARGGDAKGDAGARRGARGGRAGSDDEARDDGGGGGGLLPNDVRPERRGEVRGRAVRVVLRAVEHRVLDADLGPEHGVRGGRRDGVDERVRVLRDLRDVRDGKLDVRAKRGGGVLRIVHGR